MEIFNTDLNNNFNNSNKKNRKFSVSRIIFVILGAIILIEIIYAARVLGFPTPAIPTSPKEEITVLSAGKLFLTVSKVYFAVNEIIPVTVILDSGGHTLDGADLIVRFDPKVLEATSGGFIKRDIFEEYPLLSADMKNGVVSVSGVSILKKGFKGRGQLVTINFKAKAKGNTVLTPEFQMNSTSDSNLVEAGTSKDILEEVNNLELNIQ